MLLTDSCIFEDIRSEVSTLPDKLNFKIGEVSDFLGLEPHVLRYWEEEFTLLKPKKFSNNRRLYFKKDIEILLLIKILLYEENFKIQGVRKYLYQFYNQYKKDKPQPRVVKKELKSLLDEISVLRSQIDHQESL